MADHRASIGLDLGQEWRYHVTTRNGEPIDTSEGYTRKANAIRGVVLNRPEVGIIKVRNRKGRVVRTIVVTPRLRAKYARRYGARA